MSQPNSSVPITPGAGESIATHLVGAKEYQVVVEADHLGHMKGSRDSFLCWFTPATNAANRSVADIFNADPSVIIKVQGVWVVPTQTAITGVNIAFDLNRTSSVGTGGTSETPRPLDPNQSALSSNITARSGATGGAVLVYKYMTNYFFNDETNASVGFMWSNNLLPVISDKVVEIVLRQNQGLQIKQSVTATVGLTGALMYFVVE